MYSNNNNINKETKGFKALKETPAVPQGLKNIELSDNSKTVLSKRYLRKGEDGEPIETIQEMFWRVAYHVATGEEKGNDLMERAIEFYNMLTSKEFFPNSPTFTGAGTALGQLAACFVLPIADDMGKHEDGIFQTLRNAALIQQTGGGNGFSFSRLRQEGAYVKSSGGVSTGPIGFLKVFDQAFGMVSQGGTRRGANMAVLRVDHPDIKKFVVCKSSEANITNFNISVGITDDFMKAVRDGTPFNLMAPHTKKVVDTVDARELFDLIVEYAHHNGEPGILYLDAANRQNPVPHLYELEATNPCGEQWLGPYENCCLGSINLSKHLDEENNIDWDKLAETVRTSTKFLDNVVTANAYVPAVPKLRENALRCRRIGLGIMGLGDLMYANQIGYGSKVAEEFAGQVMEFIRYHCMATSIELAKEKGAFPAIQGSIYDPDNLKWSPPSPIEPYTMNFNRPEINWDSIVSGILQYGIRNAAQTTVAPTGTISTVAGVEGYGCEPVFALGYIRHFNDNGKDVCLNYTSPFFLKAINECNSLSDKTKEYIIQKVCEAGSCQHIKEVPKHIRDTFVVSSDISAVQHVRMQAAMQAFVDNSMSKTCNLPCTATVDDVAAVYKLAWELGCKGLTVYVAGSRSKVVLETKKEKERKENAESAVTPNPDDENNNNNNNNQDDILETLEIASSSSSSSSLGSDNSSESAPLYPVAKNGKKSRSKRLDGSTFMIHTPVGKAFITVNEDEGHPFETFITTAKAGSEIAAVSEAIGRLISYILRVQSPVPPKDRLVVIHKQLNGIGGRRSHGFGKNRVNSLPDGIAKGIRLYLESYEEREQHLSFIIEEKAHHNDSLNDTPSFSFRIGDICPSCGECALVNEEGCRKCYSCAYSEC